ncbi:MAG: peptidoglycan DD-metalloendopeptidase family protein [Ignavibacteriaceae bacterium]|nr:peptidoglycan DD-metalloendopeptidase family protein [Ignavibacteriaceae bacterium]
MVVGTKYLILFFVFVINCFPQTGDIQQKESELASIKTDIENLEQDLASKSTNERKSFESIENLNKQNYLINKILGELRIEIKDKENEIVQIEKKITVIESEITSLKDNYAKYVTAVYKKGRYNELESLIDSESLQQALMRTYYLQVFSQQREKDLIKLNDKKSELAGTKLLLDKEKNEKLVLAKSKDDGKKILTAKLNEKKRILKSIKKNKTELQKLISAKKEAQKKTENLIARLIEEEEKRKKELELKQKELIASSENSSDQKNKIKTENTEFDYDLNTSTFSSFAELKGKMIWPLYKGKIIRKFGENKNKTLNTVTLNYGVDIKAYKDKNVHCVGEGVVAALDWLPGYGNVVIISHKDGYRTVYSHLSEIFVKEGDKVKFNFVLDVVDEGLDGYVLHFEIWQGRDKQNPELWLGKK